MEWQGKGPEEVFHDIEICLDRQHRVLPPAALNRSAPAAAAGAGAGAGAAGEEAGVQEGVRFYCMPSRVCKHTNTPSLMPRGTFLRFLAPTARLDPGISLTKVDRLIDRKRGGGRFILR